jgi:cytochrome c oxidase subunit 2
MNWLRSTMLPAEGSAHARGVDDLYMFLVWLSVFFFVLIAGITLYFVYKYRRREEHVLTPNISHHLGLELTWSIIPLIIVIGIFFWGFNDYMAAGVAKNDALEIQVTGRKWNWAFEYPDGSRDVKNLHVPVGRPVRLIMSSEDVLHDFYIPDMRMKQDVIPNRYVELNFTPLTVGKKQVFCAEYCGKGHSEMMAELYVDSPADYEKFLREGPEELKNMPLPELGKYVWENKGCSQCHSLDGSRISGGGPSFKGIWNKMEKMNDGQMVMVDENYVRQSIDEPQARIVSGFEPIMPSFKGLIRDREYLGVMAFIKSLK